MYEENEYLEKLDVLNFVLKHHKIDLYSDICAYNWSFSYYKTIWNGLINDTEGREFNMYINDLNIKNSYLNSDFGVNLLKGYSDKNQSNTIITRVSSEFVRENLKIELNINTNYLYMINFIEDNTFMLYEQYSKKAYNISNMLSDGMIKKLIQNNCFSHTLDIDNFKKIKNFNYDMNDNYVNYHSSKVFYGMLGLRKLYDDLIIFSKHGNKEWMENLASNIKKQLNILTNIRVFNESYILKNKIYSPEFKELVRLCSTSWQNILTEEKLSLGDIAFMIKDIINYESIIFKKFKGKAIFNEM